MEGHEEGGTKSDFLSLSGWRRDSHTGYVNSSRKGSLNGKRFSEERFGFLRKSHIAISPREIMTTSRLSLLPPVPFDQLQWGRLPQLFTERTIRRLHRYVADFHFASLRYQVDIFANPWLNNKAMPIADAELSMLLGH
jgi:hypothetical protein